MLLTLGISHKTAPIGIREQLAFSAEQLPSALESLSESVVCDEAVVLSTCNRTEIYCSGQQPTLKDELIQWWCTHHGGEIQAQPYVYAHHDKAAVQHLMQVASGLDSMMIGEPQILGQMKTAYRVAHEMGMVGRTLSRLFQNSFAIAKKVRTHTDLVKYPVSVAYAAVTLAKQIFSQLSQASVLLVGAGENIELILQHLTSRDMRQITVVNRTMAKAEALANRYQVRAAPLCDLNQWMQQADIVMTAIASHQAIIQPHHITSAFHHQKHRPLLMIDLGVPRNIDPRVSQHDDVYLYTVDDLQGIVTENLKVREKAAVTARTMIDAASVDAYNWFEAQATLKMIGRIRQKAEQIQAEVLADALKDLDANKPPATVLQQLAHRLTQKLIHHPTLQLRQLHRHDPQSVEIVKALFDLE